MGDIITATILTAMVSGALCVVGLILSENNEIGKSIVCFIVALALIFVSALIADEGGKKQPIKVTEAPKIDTIVVYRNGAAPDTTYTYTFNPKARLD